jgi:hypothetical protein
MNRKLCARKYVASVCFVSSRGFEEMLQVFYADLAKIDLDAAMLQK